MKKVLFTLLLVISVSILNADDSINIEVDLPYKSIAIDKIHSLHIPIPASFTLEFQDDEDLDYTADNGDKIHIGTMRDEAPGPLTLLTAATELAEKRKVGSVEGEMQECNGLQCAFLGIRGDLSKFDEMIDTQNGILFAKILENRERTETYTIIYMSLDSSDEAEARARAFIESCVVIQLK